MNCSDGDRAVAVLFANRAAAHAGRVCRQLDSHRLRGPDVTTVLGH